jgi:desulfoferrodoxin (superoxide reductase-like protein)
MKRNRLFIIINAIIVAAFLSCKDDDGIDPEVAAMYKTGNKIKPLSEYTEDNPREWGKVAEDHIPQARLTTNKGKEAVVINIPLKKASMEHYIEKIGILDEKGKEIVSESLPRLPNPRTYAFFFTKDLPSDRNKLKIFAKCNLHDRWTVPLTSAKWNE